MTYKFLFAGCAAIALLAACSSTPEPVEEPVEVVEEEVMVEPDPVPEVVVPEEPEVVAIDPNLPIPGTAEDFAYQSGGEARVFFALDQYNLSPAARDVLQRQANWLNTYSNYTATIEGHADERGTREYNLALGARRADSVKAYLVGLGVAPNRLRTISYGKERPIDPRSNEEGWARNRNGFTNLSVSNQS